MIFELHLTLPDASSSWACQVLCYRSALQRDFRPYTCSYYEQPATLEIRNVREWRLMQERNMLIMGFTILSVASIKIKFSSEWRRAVLAQRYQCFGGTLNLDSEVLPLMSSEVQEIKEIRLISNFKFLKYWKLGVWTISATFMLVSCLKLRGFSPQANCNDRPSDGRLSVKLVPIFADRGCRVVSATDSHSR
jgi:hypothetical protein